MRGREERTRVEPAGRPFLNGMRSPIVGPLTRALIGFPLFVLSTRTADFFAWTIVPPVTAAVLGANYWASAVLALAASRKRLWAFGRVSVSVALVFAPVITAATFIHLEQFHLDTFYGWFWVIAYGLYPPMLAVFLVRQLRTEGEDPPRTRPLPFWVRAILWGNAALLVPVGVALFVAPEATASIWPWSLTPLTAQALAGWMLAFGVLAGHAAIENDFERDDAAFVAYSVFPVLQVVALARFADDVRWGEPEAWVYGAFVASTAVLGLYGLAARKGPPSRGARRPREAHPSA